MRETSVARRVSFSGIILAINIIILIGINYFHANTLFLMALSSLLSSIVIMEFGLKYGFLYTVASIILAFLIVGNKMQFLTYAITFGNYGFVKAVIEYYVDSRFQIIAKLVYANIAFAILFFTVNLFVKIEMNIFYILGFEIAFIIYDYVFKLFIIYYTKNLKKYLK